LPERGGCACPSPGDPRADQGPHGLEAVRRQGRGRPKRDGCEKLVRATPNFFPRFDARAVCGFASYDYFYSITMKRYVMKV